MGERRTWTMETVFRFRLPSGAIVNEWVVRGTDVELLSWLPDGSLQRRDSMTLEHFYRLLSKVAPDA